MTHRPRNLSDFLRPLTRITLPRGIKEHMRLELSAYADLHTLPENAAQPVVSPFSRLMFRTRSLYAGALALVLIVSAGTQASFASENAVPGDVLYPVKVAIAEPIALALTISAERKAELSARFASRRVDEAAALSSAGKLDEAAADELAARFDTHVDTLAKEATTLEANGDLAVSLAVRTDLEQKVSETVGSIAAAPTEVADTASVALFAGSVAVEEAPEDRFTARVYEKSRSLAITRESLDSALALDAEASENPVDLAVLRTDAQATSVFFLASSTATSTASSTAEVPATTTPAARFLSPFLKR